MKKYIAEKRHYFTKVETLLKFWVKPNVVIYPFNADVSAKMVLTIYYYSCALKYLKLLNTKMYFLAYMYKNSMLAGYLIHL